jgi:membrane protease YdiL (CAAX protease family)
VTQARASLREPLLAFTVATALGAAFGLIGTFVPLVHKYLALLIAIVFFQTPIVAAGRAGRDIDYRDLGLRADPIGLNLKVLGVLVLLTLPVFVLAFVPFYDRVCAIPTGTVARMFAGICQNWLGHARGHLRLPDGFALNAATQVIVVAIPEELFFRGYLQERLEQVWPPTRNVLGAKVGWALIVSSALFALSHVAVIPNPLRLAVFFPALLFGWMRARTGSIASAAIFHALCNLTASVMEASYFLNYR